DEQVVHAPKPFGLPRRGILADELAEVGFARHESSPPSSRSASRDSALRVRVLTVPSGSPSRSAISLCDSPLQYASSISVRSRSGNVSSALWTRHEIHDASARSSGPASSAGSSWGSAGGSA